MPRHPQLPALTLTPNDTVFLDEVDRMLYLALERLGEVFEATKPPSKYDRPAPHLAHEFDDLPVRHAPADSLSYSFVPYGREFLRSVKGLQTLCNIWIMIKTLRTQPAAAPAASAPHAAPEAADADATNSARHKIYGTFAEIDKLLSNAESLAAQT